MNETFRRIAPVLASIAVIIVMAVLRARSRVLAAVTATMPVTIALGLWIVYVAEDGDRTAVITFARSMLLGLAATATWPLTVWLGARAGWGLPRLLIVGYLAWGTTAGVIFLVQRALGGLPSG
ncbi:MAG: hypothetical protein PVH41_01850 [Anaerolineae bacterium]|jgi:hypothetical protein